MVRLHLTQGYILVIMLILAMILSGISLMMLQHSRLDQRLTHYVAHNDQLQWALRRTLAQAEHTLTETTGSIQTDFCGTSPCSLSTLLALPQPDWQPLLNHTGLNPHLHSGFLMQTLATMPAANALTSAIQFIEIVVRAGSAQNPNQKVLSIIWARPDNNTLAVPTDIQLGRQSVAMMG